jgi:hypothetical protein
MVFNFLVECGLSIQLASLAERSGLRPDQSFGPLGKVVKVRAINIKTYIYKLYNENLQTY